VKKLAITLFSFTLSFVLIAFSSVVFAQGTGKVTGKVTDKKTGEALIGATVLLQGISKGAATNVNGEYALTGIPAGTYEILVKYVGYQNKLISEVQVTNNAATALNITLDEANTQQLQAVTVRATFRQESASSLYAQQKNSARVTDGISAEAIRRSPDRNTADVLKRVSGVTVQDNKFVVVRGLSDRYNNATLDGASLPSTEPNRKAFSFDIVPSNLVDNIIISKTATPDLPGDFAGGSVQVTTKDIPDKNFITIGVGAGYNTASTFKNFKSGTRNVTDYLGFDNGYKQLSATFPSYQVLNGPPLTPEQNIASIRKLPKNWNIYNSTALPSQNYQFTIGKVKDFAKSGNRFGAIVSINYRNTQNYLQDLRRDFYDYDLTDQVYKFNTNIGALANFSYTYGKNKITFKNTYNRLYEDQFLSRAGTNQGTSQEVRFFAFDLLQKAVIKSNLEGTHAIGSRNGKLVWNVSYSNILNDQPDQRKVNYGRTIGSDNTFQANNTTVGKDNTRLFSKLNEDGFTGSVNYTVPVKFFKNTATFKTGLNSYYRKRDFDIRYIGLELRNGLDDAAEIRARPLNQLYAADLINSNKYQLKELPGLADVESYNANSLTNAGYVMLDNKAGEKLRIVWGARVEQFNLDLASRNGENPVKQNYVDVLPSVNLTYALTPKTNLRASYYRTLARPEFRELAPFQYFDYEQIATLQGNPNLKKTSIDNADLRYEYFPSAGQIISVSAFYKRFKNAIETYNNDAGSNRQILYRNSPEATVYGAEMEVRKTLNFIVDNSFLRNTTAYTNVTLIKSNAKNPPEIQNELNLNFTERPLVGQAPYVINAGLMHSFLDNKVNFNALYNVVGRRLSIVAGPSFQYNVFEAPRNVIDLQLGVKVLKNKGEIKFNANDILNNYSVLYYEVNGTKKYELNSLDETVSRYRAGSNYSFIFTYTF
jgi:TonB-dependent receptor